MPDEDDDDENAISAGKTYSKYCVWDEDDDDDGRRAESASTVGGTVPEALRAFVWGPFHSQDL